jgi:hypothetical protein
MPEVMNYEEKCFFMNVSDARALAGKMYLISVDDDLTQKIGANVKERTPHFKISNIARKTLQMNSKIVSYGNGTLRENER